MKQWYYGLADCHGVESFIDDVDSLVANMFLDEKDNKGRDAQQFAMCLRAQANAQRHAVVYRVLIEEDTAQAVQSLIKEGKYTDALTMIKEGADEVQVGTYGTTKKAAEKNWKMIPNPDLDPYHN